MKMVSKVHLSIITLIFLLSTLAKPSHSNQLIAFGTCANLRHYFRRNGLSRVGPYGVGDFRFHPIYYSPGGQGAPESDSSPTEGVDYSGTNVQVEGVDEPDIIKTDGSRVFVLRQNFFFVVHVNPSGTKGYVSGNLTLPLYPQDMLFDKDSVLVIASKYGRVFPVDRMSTERIPIIPFGSISTVLYRISVKGRVPKLVETLEIDGGYLSGRSVNGVARIIMSFNPLPKLTFRYPVGNFTEKDATRFNKNVLRRSTEYNWLPHYSFNGTRCYRKRCYKYSIKKRPLLKCSNVFYPQEVFAGFNSLTVATIQIRGPIIPTGVAIIADGNVIYATAQSLYAATTKYEYDARSTPEQERINGPRFTTSFHKFELLPDRVRYIGSGAVSGSVLNQFSLHENSDIFYIATTDGAPWWAARNTSSSKITAFEPVTNANGRTSLQKVGEVGNLGLGEQIYAVRYIGTTGYVVTFRQVDPLYIIDLSNPRMLDVTGELKIPGYSAYLHNIGDGRLLGVGQEVTLEGRLMGAKVSLFDVSDVSNPTELSTWSLKGSYTNAEWDHKAFLYWSPERVAVMPISIYSQLENEQFAGSIVLSISDERIVERGRVTHYCCGTVWERAIERNFILGSIHLWSLSARALQSNHVRNLKAESNVRLL